MKPGDAKDVDLIARSLMRDLVTVKFTCPALSMEEEATSNQCSRGRNKRHGHGNWLEVCRENMKFGTVEEHSRRLLVFFCRNINNFWQKRALYRGPLLFCH